MKPLARLLLAAALLGSLSLRALPYESQTYTVINTDDSGAGSLRWAINQANASVGYDIIEFDIPGGGVQTILLTSTFLPWIIDPVHIDGYSQSGATEATADSPAIIMVVLDGCGLAYDSFSNGLTILAADSLVEGLAVINFPLNGIALAGATATGNEVSGNHIGTRQEVGGWTDTEGNMASGISLSLGASNNVIGGDMPAERNVISGNGMGIPPDYAEWPGIDIHGSATTGNTVMGNYIGTNGAASGEVANYGHGVRIYGGATGNTIGGENTVGPLGQCRGECNVISGNHMCGVMIRGVDQPTASNVVSGNYIGLNLLAGAAIPNDEGGVCIDSSASNTIGGDSAGERNVISGNQAEGVDITGAASTANVVTGNYIGLKRDGVTPNPNAYRGLQIRAGANANTIGGSTPGEGNVISGNDSSGVEVDGENCDGNIFRGNLIGTDSSGTVAVPNGAHGIAIFNGADGTIVGGDSSGQGNLISGNDSYGIVVDGASTGTLIRGNRVGTDASGTVGFGNTIGVVLRSGATGNWIGGTTPAAGNLISGNSLDGVRIEGAASTGNTVAWNRIGTDSTGRAAMSNDQHGVRITDSADDNIVGPGNSVAFNGNCGVLISGADTEGVVVTQNSIFDNFDRGICLTTNGNNDIDPPAVTGTALGSVVISGTSACPGCAIEVFGSNNSDYKDGERYLGTTTADGEGDWMLTLGGLAYPYLTATVTDAVDGTSELSWSHFAATVRSLFLPLVLRQFP